MITCTARRHILPVLLEKLDVLTLELVDRQMDEDDYQTTRQTWELFVALNTRPEGQRYTILDGREDIITISKVKRRMQLLSRSYGPQEERS